MLIDEDFIEFTSNYFSIEKKFIHRQTRIDSISHDPHALINFSFEIEKRYNINFNDDDLAALKTVGKYIKLIKEKGGIIETRKKAA